MHRCSPIGWKRNESISSDQRAHASSTFAYMQTGALKAPLCMVQRQQHAGAPYAQSIVAHRTARHRPTRAGPCLHAWERSRPRLDTPRAAATKGGRADTRPHSFLPASHQPTPSHSLSLPLQQLTLTFSLAPPPHNPSPPWPPLPLSRPPRSPPRPARW